MVIKECVVCGKEFDAQNNQKSCSKECSKERIRQNGKQYYQANKEYVKQRSKRYYQNNKEHVQQKQKQYRQNNKEYMQQKSKQYYQANKERVKQKTKKYRQDNKEYYQQYDKKYRQDNKEHLQQYGKQYRQDNKEYYQQYHTQRIKKEVNKLIEQYNGDLEKILENIPTKWHLREAQMRVWFNESYYDGMMAKIESTPCCEITGEKDNLVIHHLWSFNTHPELGNDLANMVRITEEVHKVFHKEYGYGDNTPEQWEEFVSNYLHN